MIKLPSSKDSERSQRLLVDPSKQGSQTGHIYTLLPGLMSCLMKHLPLRVPPHPAPVPWSSSHRWGVHPCASRLNEEEKGFLSGSSLPGIVTAFGAGQTWVFTHSTLHISARFHPLCLVT